MHRFWEISLLLLIGLSFIVSGQEPFAVYKHKFFRPIVAPPSRVFLHNRAFVPLGYSGDLLTEESKRKESKGYSKKIPLRPFASEEDDLSSERFSSSEYPNDSRGYRSGETDSHEYTIGTQIRVQHPITVPKKTTPRAKYTKYGGHNGFSHSSSPYKGNTYSDVDISTESRTPDPPPPPTKARASKYTQIYEPDPFYVVQPPQSTATSGNVGYNVYESQEQQDYDPDVNNRAKALAYERYQNVASNKQIEQYLKDQKKLIDQALKLQLLTNPKFQEFLRSEEPEQKYGRDLPTYAPPPHRSAYNENPSGYKPTRLRRRPKAADLKRSPKLKPLVTTKPKRKYSAIVIDV